MPPGSERIQTSPAMVIGGTAAVAAAAIAAPAQWPKEPATARDSDWLVSDKPSTATAPAKAAPAGSRPASPPPASTSAPKDRKPSERNPMPGPPASNTNGGNGMLIAAGLLGLAVLVGGGGVVVEHPREVPKGRCYDGDCACSHCCSRSFTRAIACRGRIDPERVHCAARCTGGPRACSRCGACGGASGGRAACSSPGAGGGAAACGPPQTCAQADFG